MDNSSIKLDEDLISKVVVHKNLSQEIIVTNVDKVKLLLIAHHQIVKQKIDWLTPFSILVTISATLLTAKFDKSFIGISAELWNALFIVACVVSLISTVIYLRRAIINLKKGTVEDFIEKLKIESK